MKKNHFLIITMCCIISLINIFSVKAQQINHNEINYDDMISQYEQDFPDIEKTYKNLKNKSISNINTNIIHKQNNINSNITDTYTYHDTIFDNNTESLIAKVSISCILTNSSDNNNTKPSCSILGKGQVNEGDWDATMSVYASSIIYYKVKKTTDENTKLYLLYQVDVANKISDKTVSIKKQKLTYGCSGMADNGVPTSQIKTQTPSGTKKTYKTGFKTYIRKEYVAEMGATYTLTLGRQGKHTWKLELINNLF
ncbi:hypothetical protein SAMN05216249_1443 [Acetitomaculum ruminis DSM 5522]|uniref:Uncharacterized protein n=1 Tax=Acetitomaculum ruminis DSM 5522 TaxID=1120918 RepID=A0A1I1ARU5_9FIRM|nr:hypothetical protein [Acetitomaculum ruminis]SFB40785.1 hypothetical protein SAMN05216249_1443 [Acetitomaculum ruminis DSM 5522]